MLCPGTAPLRAGLLTTAAAPAYKTKPPSTSTGLAGSFSISLAQTMAFSMHWIDFLPAVSLFSGRKNTKMSHNSNPRAWELVTNIKKILDTRYKGFSNFTLLNTNK